MTYDPESYEELRLSEPGELEVGDIVAGMEYEYDLSSTNPGDGFLHGERFTASQLEHMLHFGPIFRPRKPEPEVVVIEAKVSQTQWNAQRPQELWVLVKGDAFPLKEGLAGQPSTITIGKKPEAKKGRAGCELCRSLGSVRSWVPCPKCQQEAKEPEPPVDPGGDKKTLEYHLARVDRLVGQEYDGEVHLSADEWATIKQAILAACPKVKKGEAVVLKGFIDGALNCGPDLIYNGSRFDMPWEVSSLRGQRVRVTIEAVDPEAGGGK